MDRLRSRILRRCAIAIASVFVALAALGGCGQRGGADDDDPSISQDEMLAAFPLADTLAERGTFRNVAYDLVIHADGSGMLTSRRSVPLVGPISCVVVRSLFGGLTQPYVKCGGVMELVSQEDDRGLFLLGNDNRVFRPVALLDGEPKPPSPCTAGSDDEHSNALHRACAVTCCGATTCPPVCEVACIGECARACASNSYDDFAMIHLLDKQIDCGMR